MRFLRWLVLVVLVLVGASCGREGGKFPDESDVPQEALVVMPGAVEVESAFAKGQRTRNVDGGVRDSSTIQSVEYAVDGVTGRDVYEFYLAELSGKGWEFHDASAGLLDPPGGEPGQCLPGGEGYCGQFDFRGPEGSDDHIGVIHSMMLLLFYGMDETGEPAGVEHIDDEIDGYEIRILVGFAP